MHIIHYNLTTTTKTGGVETFVWDLAGEQARRGHRVSIVGGAGSVRRFFAGVAVRTVPYIDRSRFAVGPLRRAYAWRKLAERLSMLPAALPLLRDADLVHIHKPYDLVLAPWLRRRGVPLIYHGHGEDFFPGDVRLMRHAAALLSCSAYNAATLKAHYGREATIVYNGVDVEHFHPSLPDSMLRTELQRNAQYVLLMPGRLMPWKGHRTAIEAMARLDSNFARLYIIGAGETAESLRRYSAELGVEDRVVLQPTVDHRELPRYFAAADLVIGASYASETFGMILAEALACERPVVASSWRGYDDVVIDDRTGARFPAQDAPALAQIIHDLLLDAPRRQRYATAGREHVVSTFAWPRVAERVQAVYDDVGIRA